MSPASTRLASPFGSCASVLGTMMKKVDDTCISGEIHNGRTIRGEKSGGN